MLLKIDRHRHADPHVINRRARHVGHQPHIALLLELDDGDDVRHCEIGLPLLVVDGETGHIPRPETACGATLAERQAGHRAA